MRGRKCVPVNPSGDSRLIPIGVSKFLIALRQLFGARASTLMFTDSQAMRLSIASLILPRQLLQRITVKADRHSSKIAERMKRTPAT
jgi:hypothetical protein